MKVKLIFLFFTVLVLSSIQVTPAFAFPVDPLPGDNLIANPWFRSRQNPSNSSLDQWTDGGGPNKHWSSSQKESNPTPDILQSGVCGHKKVYCGTAARISPTMGESGGLAEPEVDSYLYQVVTANASHQKLKFFMHWVTHRVEIGEVTIYGGNTRNGPWESVWVPFSFSLLTEAPRPTGNRNEEWRQTDMLETVLPKGYAFYKVEFHVRLPPPRYRQGDIGMKFTGIYFAAEAATSADMVQASQTATATSQVTAVPSPTTAAPRRRPSRTLQSSAIPSATTTTPTFIPSATPWHVTSTPATRLDPVVPSGEQPAQPPETNLQGLPWVGVLLFVLAIFIGVVLYNRRH